MKGHPSELYAGCAGGVGDCAATVHQLFAADECPVGYYVDPNQNMCTPICAQGYKFDKQLKKCVRA